MVRQKNTCKIVIDKGRGKGKLCCEVNLVCNSQRHKRDTARMVKAQLEEEQQIEKNIEQRSELYFDENVCGDFALHNSILKSDNTSKMESTMSTDKVDDKDKIAMLESQIRQMKQQLDTGDNNRVFSNELVAKTKTDKFELGDFQLKTELPFDFELDEPINNIIFEDSDSHIPTHNDCKDKTITALEQKNFKQAEQSLEHITGNLDISVNKETIFIKMKDGSIIVPVIL